MASSRLTGPAAEKINKIFVRTVWVSWAHSASTFLRLRSNHNMEVVSETSSSVDPALGLATLSIQPEPRMITIKGADWECRSDAQQGRFLVAKIDFQPGDIVISELPFAFIPFDGPRAQVWPLLLAAMDRLVCLKALPYLFKSSPLLTFSMS
jgi:hypothetical protein